MRAHAALAVLAITTAASALGSAAVHLGPWRRPGQGGAMPAPGQGGTAVIRGQVVTTLEGRPVRGATLTLSCMEPPPRFERTATSDLDGRFTFADLPAGRCFLTARKMPYLDTDYGQDRATGRKSQEIVLVDGKVTDNIVVHLPRGGVIAGRVLNQEGEPANVTVQLRIPSPAGGGLRLMDARGRGLRTSARPDDFGRYRLFGLSPGEYYVAVSVGAGRIYYPGVDDVAFARTVTVEPDGEVGNVDLVVTIRTP